MPWEGFLGLIKAIFEMTNYKGAPYTVCCFWSMKTALQMLSKENESWFKDIIYTESESIDYNLSAASLLSPLVSSLHQSMASLLGVRHLSSFERGPVEVRLGEFILTSLGTGMVVGMVAEIVEAFTIGASVIRMRLDCAREVGAVDSERGGVFTVAKLQPCIEGDAIVLVESASICELHAFLENGWYTFTY